MYTSESKHFSEAFKQKAMMAIARQIEAFKAMPQEEFASRIEKSTYSSYGADDVYAHGRRWKDSEQVYQALIMGLSDRMRKERGPGILSEGEAKALEMMFMLPTCEYMFDVVAKEAVVQAAGTDHWYMFEKQWD